MQTASDWELWKENIQPLKKGRVMANLQSALLPQGEFAVRPKLIQQKSEFEVLLRSYVGEDPLEPWQAYIDWTEQNFPKGGKEGSLSDLLQQCILTFKNDARYANDRRFVDICLKFADLAPDIMEVYQYMYSMNIGVQTAAFFQSWALQHENLGNIRKADELFQDGMRRRAEPKEELEMSYRQFTARILNNMHEKVEPTSPPKDKEEHRTTLGLLKATGKKCKVGATRTGAAKLGRSQGVPVQVGNGPNARARFPIFCDENAAPLPPTPVPSMPIATPAMAGAKKENERKPDKWTDVKVRQKVSSTPVNYQRPFSIHVDENACTPQQTPSQNVLPDSNVLSARKTEYPNALEGIRRVELPAANCRQVAMYCKEKLFRGVTEFQFEELRAIKWRERHKKREEERKLKEREMQLMKREENLEILSARLKSIMAKGGNGMLDEVGICMKLIADLQSDVRPDSTDCNNGLRVQEVPESKVPPDSKGTDSACSSAPSSQSKTPNSTGNTTHFVRAMWNGTLAEGAEEVPSLVPAIAPSRPVSRKCAFTVYGDEDAQNVVEAKNLATETTNGDRPVLQEQDKLLNYADENAAPLGFATAQEEGAGVNHDMDDEENLQNIPPNDYPADRSLLKLAGIPKPSTDVSLLADKELAFEADNDFAMEGIAPLAGKEFTMTCPSNASFMTNLRISSTPSDCMPFSAARSVSDNRYNWSVRNITSQLPSKLVSGQTENGRFFKTPGAKPFPAMMDSQRFSMHTRNDLSTISEASNEYRSSSSSSSSSAATSHFKSQLLRNKTEDETCALVEKIDKSNVLVPRDEDVLGDCSNPFKNEITEGILECLALPLTDRKGYCELTRAMPVLRENSHIQLDNDMYCIDKLCNTGGFAKIFCGSEMGFGSWQNQAKKLAFKVQKPACRWEFYIASEILSRIKNLERPVDVTPSFMNISKMFVYASGSILVTDFHKYGTILDVVNYFTSRSAPVPEPLALYFTIEMLYVIEQLHACRIIHADIKPDNFLVMSLNIGNNVDVSGKSFEAVVGGQTRCLKLVDYGRSIDMNSLPPGTTFTKSVKTDSFECGEMKEGRPWTYQTDFYGLASCSHTLLFGSYMKTVKQEDSWKISAPLKRYWHQTEWTNYFHHLLNIPNCDSQPDVVPLRKAFEDCLFSKKVIFELCSTLKQLEDVFNKKNGPSFH